MSNNLNEKNICPECGRKYPKAVSQCLIDGHKFDNTNPFQTVNDESFQDRPILEKYPWLKYFGLFGLFGLFFGVMILISSEIITNTTKQLSGYVWASQAISGGVISLLVGCIQLIIFHQNINKRFYLFFLVSSLFSGIIAGYLITLIIKIDFPNDAFMVGSMTGALSGAITSMVQGTFIFNKKSQNYKSIMSKWIIYHVLSWYISWGLGWLVSWKSASTQSLALGFVVIMALSGVLFAAFLHFLGDVDYA